MVPRCNEHSLVGVHYTKMEVPSESRPLAPQGVQGQEEKDFAAGHVIQAIAHNTRCLLLSTMASHWRSIG